MGMKVLKDLSEKEQCRVKDELATISTNYTMSIVKLADKYDLDRNKLYDTSMSALMFGGLVMDLSDLKY